MVLKTIVPLNILNLCNNTTKLSQYYYFQVIPNAILVCTEGEKNFLTSFSGRDKAYLMLFRIWQNALMDQPMSSHEIWQWVSVSLYIKLVKELLLAALHSL